MRLSAIIQRGGVGACLLVSSVAMAQQQESPSLQATLEQSAAANAFTFVVFYRDGGEAGHGLARQVTVHDLNSRFA